MLISLNTIKKFIDLPKDIGPDKIADLLTMKTMEIEGWEKSNKYLEKIVVGEVSSVEKHPEADRLQVCKVDIGEKDLLNVVCGGNNVKEGMSVAFAPIGAKVAWHGTEEVVLEKTKIRGVESEGMICASEEIALAELFPSIDDHAILDLSENKWEKGKLLSEYLLDDIIIEVDNKSINHRPDLWGHYGIARELSAILHLPLKNYADFYHKKNLELTSTGEHIEIKDKSICDNYLGIKVKNLDNRQAPLWLKQILSNLGIKSISALVDISNYVMIESGQPMHVFDAKKLANEKIIIRNAKEDEKFKALDEEDYFLKTTDVVISDEDEAIALAGVIGGLDSAVSAETKEVILEFAHFPDNLIRRTSMHTGLRTEASMRFEKSLDVYNIEKTANRTWALITEIFPEAEIEWIDQAKSYSEKANQVKINSSEFSRLAGIKLDSKEVVDILSSLGFGIREDEKTDELTVNIPTWRSNKDVTLPIDLVEEVLRIYGYDNIPVVYPNIELKPPVEQVAYDLKNNIIDYFVLNAKMNEIYNYSFLQLDTIKKLGINNLGQYIYLDNPVDKTRPVLRDDLIYNLLENIVDNQKNFEKFSAFEIARVFKNDEKDVYNIKPESEERLSWQHQLVAGFMIDADNDKLIYKLKSTVESLFKFLSKSYIIEEGECPDWIHPYKALVIKVKDNSDNWKEIGYLGMVNPLILENFSIKNPVAYFSFDLDELENSFSSELEYKAINKFPSIDLDTSLLINKDVKWVRLKKLIKSENILVKDLEFIETYEKKEWNKDNLHSLTLRVIYQSEDGTLELEEVNKIHEKIKAKLVAEFNCEIR